MLFTGSQIKSHWVFFRGYRKCIKCTSKLCFRMKVQFLIIFYFNSFISLEVFQIINTCLLNALIFQDLKVVPICYTKSRINSQGEQLESNSKECEIGFVLRLLLWLEKRGISAIFHMRLKKLNNDVWGNSLFCREEAGNLWAHSAGEDWTDFLYHKEELVFFLLASAQVSKGKFGFWEVAGTPKSPYRRLKINKIAVWTVNLPSRQNSIWWKMF